MKAAIFDPYLDTLGGGERYVMTFAQTLKKNGWDVDIEWNDNAIIEKLEERLGLHLMTSATHFRGVNVVSSISKGKNYDLCFWLSDGSIPNLSARNNILHFQVPFHNVNGRSLVNRIKLRKIKNVVCNSQFTKKFIDEEYGINSLVLYPPVNVEEFKSSNKRNVILFVGRFSQLLQAKRQDVLVTAFRDMVDRGLKDWKLIVAGGSDVGGKEFVGSLRFEARGYPIDIIENPDFNQLKELYRKAKIFWSASGYGMDEEKESEKVEHFGITVVEAMASGCAPVLLNKGGHQEIVDDGENGILWDTEEQLISVTNDLITDVKKLRKISVNAKRKAEKFSVKRFEDEVTKFIN